MVVDVDDDDNDHDDDDDDKDNKDDYHHDYGYLDFASMHYEQFWNEYSFFKLFCTIVVKRILPS